MKIVEDVSNVFDDFAAVLRHLVQRGYTRSRGSQ